MGVRRVGSIVTRSIIIGLNRPMRRCLISTPSATNKHQARDTDSLPYLSASVGPSLSTQTRGVKSMCAITKEKGQNHTTSNFALEHGERLQARKSGLVLMSRNNRWNRVLVAWTNHRLLDRELVVPLLNPDVAPSSLAWGFLTVEGHRMSLASSMPVLMFFRP